MPIFADEFHETTKIMNRDYDRIAPWKKELTRKIGLMGLSDLRKLAPIGDLGYANGWETWNGKGWMYGGMEKAIVHAFWEQSKKYGFKDEGYSTGYRNTDHHTVCKELGLRWSVDSSD